MHYTNILVPYDTSDNSRRALQEAVEILGDNPDAKLTVFNVCDTPEVEDVTFDIAARLAGMVNLEPAGVDDMRKEFIDTQTKRISDHVADIIEPVKDRTTVVVRPGRANDQVVRFANEGNYDLIVMGSRGLNALQGMLGSVSYTVLHSVNIPTFIVR